MMLALGWMLFHAIWQGVLVWLLSKIASYFLRNLTAQYQYIVQLGLLFCFFCAAMLTFYQQLGDFNYWQKTLLSDSYKLNEVQYVLQFPLEKDWQQTLEQYFPLIVKIWGLGILLLAGKWTYGYKQLYQLQKQSIEQPDWTEKLHKWTRQWKLIPPIRLRFSDNISSPFVMGCIRPIILMPIGLLGQLSPTQIESLLLHELVHIRRYDFSVNLFQCMLETIFFFHPCIYLLSGNIRLLRERACDEEVLHLTQQPLIYAKALAALEQYRLRSYAPALAAADNKFQLFNRIKHIMEAHHSHQKNKGSRLLAIMLMAAAFGTVYGMSSPIVQENVPKVVNVAQKAWDKVQTISAAITPIMLSDLQENALLEEENATESYTSSTPPDTISADSVILNEEKGMVQIYKNGRLIKEVNTPIQAPIPPLPPIPPMPPLPPLAPAAPLAPDAPKVIIWKNSEGGKGDKTVEVFLADGKTPQIYTGDAADQKLEEMSEEIKNPEGNNKLKKIQIHTEKGDVWVFSDAPNAEDIRIEVEKGMENGFRFNTTDEETFRLDMENQKRDLKQMKKDTKTMRKDLKIMRKDMIQSEKDRIQSEKDMIQSEKDRIQSEKDRIQSEKDRKIMMIEMQEMGQGPQLEDEKGEGPGVGEYLLQKGYVKHNQDYTFKINAKGAFLNGKKLPDQVLKDLHVGPGTEICVHRKG